MAAGPSAVRFVRDRSRNSAAGVDWIPAKTGSWADSLAGSPDESDPGSLDGLLQQTNDRWERSGFGGWSDPAVQSSDQAAECFVVPVAPQAAETVVNR